jgi:probable rRNA maturation factor
MGSRPKSSKPAGPAHEASRRRGIELEVLRDAPLWQQIDAAEALARTAADALARHPAVSRNLPVRACITLGDDRAMRRLNAQWRGKDKPTNVLSFPSASEMPHGPGPRFAGDVVLAAETVFAEARDLGKPAEHHLQHLVLHGLLHLLGFDHETDADAAVMERIETETLALLGISDPYACGEVATN